jgi:hypothetical protein
MTMRPIGINGHLARANDSLEPPTTAFSLLLHERIPLIRSSVQRFIRSHAEGHRFAGK